MSSLTVNNSFPQDPFKQAEAIRSSLRCGRAGCACQRGSNVHCPAHDDETPSLSVTERDGKVLVFCHAGCPSRDVIDTLRTRGLWPTGRTGAGEPVHRVRYELRDVNGNLLAIHVREDLPGGRKRFFWAMPDGRFGLDGVRPVDLLYGLERLRDHPGEPVVVVEGEKAASALQQVGILAIGTVCGAATTPSETVLRHLLDRPVVLWPDNDEPGRRHMTRIAEILHRLGHRDVRLIEPPEDVPEGWDAADAIAEGRDVRAIIASARPYNPPSLFKPVSLLTAPPITWACEPLVPCGALTVLSGKDKRGKTLFALELVRSVLLGKPFLGQFNVRQGPVVAAFLDDPLAITLERLEALGIRRHPDLYLVDPRIVEDPHAVLQELEVEAKQRRAVLVVWDAFYHLLPTGRESLNDASLMRPLVLALDGLAARVGCGFVTVGHDNKSGSDVAGSFVVRAAAKSILRLTLPSEQAREDDEPPMPRRHLTLESKLTRPEIWALDLEGPGRWIFLGTARQAREGDLQAALLGFVRTHGPATREEILRGVPGKAASKVRALEELARRGLLVVEGGGRKGDPRRFRVVAPEGEPDTPRTETPATDSVPEAPIYAGNGERNRLKPRQDAEQFRSRGSGTESVSEGLRERNPTHEGGPDNPQGDGPQGDPHPAEPPLDLDGGESLGILPPSGTLTPKEVNPDWHPYHPDMGSGTLKDTPQELGTLTSLEPAPRVGTPTGSEPAPRSGTSSGEGMDGGLEGPQPASGGPENPPEFPPEPPFREGGDQIYPPVGLGGSEGRIRALNGRPETAPARMTTREPDGSIRLAWGEKVEVVGPDDLRGWRLIEAVEGVPLEIPQEVQPPVVVLDVESSGLNPEVDRLLAAGILLKDPDGLERTLVFRGFEREILEGVTRTLLNERPRILVVFNGLCFDFVFLAARARSLGMEFPIELDPLNPVRVSGTAGVLGKEPISFPRILKRPEGLPVVDVFGLVVRLQNQTRTLGSRLDLKSVASALGVSEPGRLHLPHERIPEVSEEALEEYLRSDLRETLRLFELLATPYLLIAKVTKLPVEDVVVRGAPWVWEQLLERHYKYRPEPDPKEKYEGGLVLCRRGLFRSSIKVDVNSLYPHIMLTYDIRSKKDPDGHMLSWLRSLLEERLRIKARAKAGDPLAKVADAALKVMLNSAYGFLGSGYPFNDMRAAAAVTAYGRKLLTAMVAAAEDAGGTVVAADTDGLVVSTEEPERVLSAITAALPNPFKISLEWSGCTVFASDPKNYLVLGPQGELFEARGAKWRGSDRETLWTKFPLEFLRRLTVESVDSAFEYARAVKRQIESGNGWTWVVRTHRVGAADKTLLASGFREGEVAVYTYKRFKTSRKEISRSPDEGYDVHYYRNVFLRVVGEISEVCGLEVPEDLRPTKRRKREGQVASGASDEKGGGDSEVKLKEAVEFLKDILERGPVPVEEILEKAAERSLSRRTVFRAKEHLKVKAYRSGGRWWWSLSEVEAEPVAQGAAVEGSGKDLEDEAPSGDPVTEQPRLEGVASEDSRADNLLNMDAGRPVHEVERTEGGQGDMGGSPPTEAEVRDLVAILARSSPGPHHNLEGWVIGLCPVCGQRTIAWKFRPPEVVVVCGCPEVPGWARAPELPVRPLALR